MKKILTESEFKKIIREVLDYISNFSIDEFDIEDLDAFSKDIYKKSFKDLTSEEQKDFVKTFLYFKANKYWEALFDQIASEYLTNKIKMEKGFEYPISLYSDIKKLIETTINYSLFEK